MVGWAHTDCRLTDFEYSLSNEANRPPAVTGWDVSCSNLWLSLITLKGWRMLCKKTEAEKKANRRHPVLSIPPLRRKH
jgi:hypothetical protein